ncbi:restriction endonuclease subunit S [Microcoleus sp. S13C4]|uniref:restriction endonuclease subunit S n=1 Tax=Microcoleus sp. S13C4 TaxID=3055410 RepID=UPI002FD1A2DE
MSKINGWQSLPLEDLTSLIKDGTHGTHQDIDSGVPLLSAKDIRNGVLEIPNDCRRISFFDYSLIHKNYEIAKNDILLTVVGSIGRCYLVSGSEPRFTIQRSVSVIRPQSINANYLYHYFLSENFQRQLKNSVNASAQGGVYLGTLANCLVNFPTCKEEQEQIAAVLSTIDRAITQTEAIIVKQQRIKTGLMQDLLTKGIDEKGNIRSEATHEFKDSAIGRIPVEWDVELLDKLGERGSGHTPNKSHPNYWNGGIKWVSLADSNKLDQIYIFDTDKEISTQGLKNSSAVLHPKGTVILSRDAGVGKSAILGTEMAVSQHFIVWQCGTNLNNYYLYYWLQKEKPKFEGIASGSTIVTIGLQFFRQYQIAIPKLIDEQNLIAEIIKKSDKCILKHRGSLEKLKRRKTGLMQDLLTGKVRVTNLLKEKDPTSP